jgi:ribonuclease HI
VTPARRSRRREGDDSGTAFRDGAVPAVATTPAHDEVWLYTDGAARGNPGPAAIGFLVLDSQGGRLAEHAECIGGATNNEAEYTALIAGLTACARLTKGRVRCVSDSELMVKQLTGVYRTKEPRLRELQDESEGNGGGLRRGHVQPPAAVRPLHQPRRPDGERGPRRRRRRNAAPRRSDRLRRGVARSDDARRASLARERGT